MHVTLTFDNGPDPVGTPAALSALADRGIPAVFFVVGQKARAHAGLVARTSAAGHLVGNHTWSHSTPFGEARRPGFARREITRTQEVIASSAATPPLFRPVGAAPGAVVDRRLLDDEALQTLVEGGYTMALWNVVPRDWERPGDWVDTAIAACRTTEHAVVVLHDGHPQGMASLPGFLDTLLDEQTRFDTDFPPSCTPIRAGIPGPEVDALVAVAPQCRPSRPRTPTVVSPSPKEQQ